MIPGFILILVVAAINWLSVCQRLENHRVHRQAGDHDPSLRLAGIHWGLWLCAFDLLRSGDFLSLAGTASNLLLAFVLAVVLHFAPVTTTGVWPGLAFLALLQVTAVLLIWSLSHRWTDTA